jgi:hypothetical protein
MTTHRDTDMHRRQVMSGAVLGATAATIGLAIPASATAQRRAPDAAQAVQRLIDLQELARIPTEIEIAVDRKDWPRARACFTDRIRVDFTSLAGGEPASIPADALIQGWSSNLRGNKESLHMRGDVLVSLDGDEATVESNGYAYNAMPGAPDGSGEMWEVWGVYIHKLVRTSQGWKVNDFTFRATRQRGSTWVRDTPGS